MVENTLNLDNVFKSLGDPTRRDILHRLTSGSFSVTEIAKHYSMSLAAVSKHLQVLEKARLIKKQKRGNEHIIGLSPSALRTASEYLQDYQKYWESELDALEVFLQTKKEKS